MSLYKKAKEKVASPEFKEGVKKAAETTKKSAKEIAGILGNVGNRLSNYWDDQLKRDKKGKDSLF